MDIGSRGWQGDAEGCGGDNYSKELCAEPGPREGRLLAQD